MGKPTAAPNHFPYASHRTVEDVWREARDLDQTIVDLTALSRRRALSLAESLRLEALIRKQSRLAA